MSETFKAATQGRELITSKEELRKQGVRKVTYVTKMVGYVIVELEDGTTRKKMIVDDVRHHVYDVNDYSCSSKIVIGEFDPPAK